MAVDHGRLIANAVRWALGKTPQVTIEGVGVVDIALREDAGGLALTLFNLTNPMMMKGPIRENQPIGPQRVSIELPAGKSVGTRVLLVVADRAAAFTVARWPGHAWTFPGIERLEVVHLTWA